MIAGSTGEALASRAPTAAQLDALIREATLDCYDKWEETAGLFTALEARVELPFMTQIGGAQATVERFELTNENQIAAIYQVGSVHHAMPLVDLPLPARGLKGAEWIEAYRQWARRP